MTVTQAGFRRRLLARKATAVGFVILAIAATGVGIAALAVLMVDLTREGIGRVSWDFINAFPSRKPEEAGIKAALWGTIWMMGLTAAFAIPIGVGAAIYLEEYAPRNWLTRVIQTNIANLAGVPSLVYGILGLAPFVPGPAPPRRILIGALPSVAFPPSGPLDDFTVLPIQIFNWAARPQAGFHENAAAAIIVLLVVLLTMNAAAIILRNYFQARTRGR